MTARRPYARTVEVADWPVEVARDPDQLAAAEARLRARGLCPGSFPSATTYTVDKLTADPFPCAVTFGPPAPRAVEVAR